MTVPTITLEQYRAMTADARAALRMIREIVEQHAPTGSVPSEDGGASVGADINYQVSSQAREDNFSRHCNAPLKKKGLRKIQHRPKDPSGRSNFK